MALEERQREFVRLLTQNERAVYAFIFSLAPDWDSAEEILQETNIRMWERFDDFTPGTNFRAWAISMAKYQVLTYRKRKKRNNLLFDGELLEKIATSLEPGVELAEARQKALHECIGELSERSRHLLGRCYAEGTRIKDVARSLGRSPDSIYKAVQRLRMTLHDCIRQRLQEEGME